MIKEIVIKRAKKLAQRDADSVCQYFSYQPILPQQVKDLKKQKDKGFQNDEKTLETSCVCSNGGIVSCRYSSADICRDSRF